jgi:hypothetical protein
LELEPPAEQWENDQCVLEDEMGSDCRIGGSKSDWLPETEWEVIEQRTSIPSDLQGLFNAPAPIIRVPNEGFEQ